MIRRTIVLLWLISTGVVAPVAAQTPAGPPTQTGTPVFKRSLWIVGGGGFSVARASCATCDRAGVFSNTRSVVVDVGVRASQRVDAGVELLWVTSKIESEEPIRTTFIVGLAQFRPWVDKPFFLRAGMGVGFVGNGLWSPIGPALSPPFSTNALGVMYGIGWTIKTDKRFNLQIHLTQHVAALGELTTVSGSSLRNVVGNYWTIGTALVLR